MLIHTVQFWFHRDRSTDDIAACRAALDGLRAIPTVRQLWTGLPVDTGRPIVDLSYDLGLTVVVDDQAGHDAYQGHPLHLAFVAAFKPMWRQVRVFDWA